MKVGIVGLPGSGKTTLFRALTRGTIRTEHSTKANVGVVSVPDSRIDYFAAQYNPKKITYASIEYIDGAAKIEHEGGHTKFGSDFFADVRQVDALVPVIRGFDDVAGESPSPVADFQKLIDELVISDLQMIENRLFRVEKQLHGVKKGTTTPATVEIDFLERVKACLEEGGLMRSLNMDAEEEKMIRGYDFLTTKPMVAVLNIPEERISAPSDADTEFLKQCEDMGVRGIRLCVELEMEVSQLSDEDEAEFLTSMNISEPARNVLINECYTLLGLISFITAGEPEVRAWTLRAGSRAVEAAGTIHSDIARGFIRAEVANFKDIEVVGSWEVAKTKNIVQLQGKDYIIQDGDVLYIRFKI